MRNDSRRITIGSGSGERSAHRRPGTAGASVIYLDAAVMADLRSYP